MNRLAICADLHEQELIIVCALLVIKPRDIDRAIAFEDDVGNVGAVAARGSDERGSIDACRVVRQTVGSELGNNGAPIRLIGHSDDSIVWTYCNGGK
ncbi:hypothetical protein [Pseudolysobacter antarcticus]|uniref:hypothetical protein n=1 Tax=Pseudolysobacter antarcticus TaxID=2511995 RepID=UPI001F5C12A6|nr:hypothetical protein [Pseudolysobacter antarcticus]